MRLVKSGGGTEANGDYDLAAGDAVVFESNAMPANPTEMLIAGLLKVGDGTKNLAGSGTMTVKMTVDDIPIFTTAVAILGQRQVFSIPPLFVPGNGTTIDLILTSSNAADTDVDVTAYLLAADMDYKFSYTAATASPTALSLEDRVKALQNANVWYVTKTGNDSNDGHSLTQAKLTIGAAVTAAANGDKIIIHPGTYDEAVNLDTADKSLILEGTDRNTCIIQPSAGGVAVTLENDCTVRNLSCISQVHNGTFCIGLRCQGKTRVLVENCYLEGSATAGSGTDGAVFAGSSRIMLRDSIFYSTWDALQQTLGELTMERCRCFSDGTHADAGVEGRAFLSDSNNTKRHYGTLARDCVFSATRTISHSSNAVAVRVRGRMRFANCTFIAYTGGSATGTAYGLQVADDTYQGTSVVLDGCNFRVLTDAAGQTAYDIKNDGAVPVHLSGTRYVAATGSVDYDVAASVTGNVGGNVTGSIGSLATQAKADVKAQVDLSVAAIPTVGDGSVSVDHNYGGADALSAKTAGGAGIDGVTVRAYLTTDYTAGNRGSDYVQGQTTTLVTGQWEDVMRLDPGNYTLEYALPSVYQVATQTVTVS